MSPAGSPPVSATFEERSDGGVGAFCDDRPDGAAPPPRFPPPPELPPPSPPEPLFDPAPKPLAPPDATSFVVEIAIIAE
jgi:hypothetical protein